MKHFLVLLILFFLTPACWAQSLSIYCEESAPYQMSRQDGTLNGMSIEIVREIQKRINNTDPIQMVPWNRAYTLTLKNENTVLFSMAMTEERKDLFQWVGPVADLSLAFYEKKGSGLRITSHEDAKKVQSIGVYANDVGEQYLKKMGYTNLVHSYDNDVSLRNLMYGRINLISLGRSASRLYAEKAGYKADDLQEVFVYMKSSLYIVFSKKTPSKTVETWNNALTSMKKDGSFASIYYKYFPGTPLP